MRLRHLIAKNKLLKNDTGWSTSDMPPRHCPVYTKTKPITAGWQWRALHCEGADNTKFILTIYCNPRRDNWQAFLIIETNGGASVVARFEHHASHPGLHGHGHCDRGGLELGTSGLDGLLRFPKVGESHRRSHAWTEGTFLSAAKKFFRVTEDRGPLFNAC